MYEIRAKYFNEFGIVIDYSALTQFSSLGDSCDEMTGGNYLNTCVHGSNTECSNSSGFGNANKELHHLILVLIPLLFLLVMTIAELMETGCIARAALPVYHGDIRGFHS